ncbi:MAG: hypothetical protein EKK53_09805 [Burkholderiales bacterium]|nr:MAG: hypothetical protein EKK53_09805 [Burkholderiales bacterium]
MNKFLPWLMLAAAFGGGWLLAPAPAADAPLVSARRDAWRLPDLPRRPDQAAKAIGLAASPVFEQEAAQAVAAGPAEDKRWRVAGFFGRGSERKVLISFAAAAKPSLRLAVGDKVPSGERITKIEDGVVMIRAGNKQVPLGADFRE